MRKATIMCAPITGTTAHSDKVTTRQILTVTSTTIGAHIRTLIRLQSGKARLTRLAGCAQCLIAHRLVGKIACKQPSEGASTMHRRNDNEISRLLRLKRYEQPPGGLTKYTKNFRREFWRRQRERDELFRQPRWR